MLLKSGVWLTFIRTVRVDPETLFRFNPRASRARRVELPGRYVQGTATGERESTQPQQILEGRDASRDSGRRGHHRPGGSHLDSPGDSSRSLVAYPCCRRSVRTDAQGRQNDRGLQTGAGRRGGRAASGELFRVHGRAWQGPALRAALPVCRSWHPARQSPSRPTVRSTPPVSTVFEVVLDGPLLGDVDDRHQRSRRAKHQPCGAIGPA